MTRHFDRRAGLAQESQLLRAAARDERAIHMKLRRIQMASVVKKHSISSELAQKMVDAAVAKARENGVSENVAILDDGGNLKAFCRMDGAPILCIEIAQDKAYTALFRVSTYPHTPTKRRRHNTSTRGLFALPTAASARPAACRWFSTSTLPARWTTGTRW